MYRHSVNGLYRQMVPSRQQLSRQSRAAIRDDADCHERFRNDRRDAGRYSGFRHFNGFIGNDHRADGHPLFPH